MFDHIDEKLLYAGQKLQEIIYRNLLSYSLYSPNPKTINYFLTRYKISPTTPESVPLKSEVDEKSSTPLFVIHFAFAAKYQLQSVKNFFGVITTLS